MKKVLIAEDDIQLHHIYKIKMKAAGFDIRIVKNGEEVMAILSEFKPDVIVLDLLMPKKDGYQTLEEIKKDPKFKNIPILVTSNLSRPFEIDRVQQMGATDYIVKSNISLEELIARINAA